MNQKIRLITVTSFALLGILSISSGLAYSSLEQKKTDQQALVVIQYKQSPAEENVSIKLKDLTIEVNTPLSVKIVDYLQEEVTDEVLANLKLDTSSVNVTQAGTYQYIITYKDDVYTGNIIVKEKEIPVNTLQSITLKPINIKKGSTLSTDISTYIVEEVPEELKASMLLDLSNVNVNIAATYQYTITYNNSIYTANITVTEDQSLQTLNPSEETEENKEQNNQEEENTVTTQESEIQQ